MYEDAPFELSISVADDVRVTRIRAPEAVKGILVELIRNAVKHYDQAFSNITVPVSVKFVGREVIWRVSNRCSTLTGHLDFTSNGSGDHSARECFGATVIRDIVLRAYRVNRPEEMVRFPSNPSDGWVHVDLVCLVEEGV